MKDVSKTNCRYCNKVIGMGSKCGCAGEMEHLNKTSTMINTKTGIKTNATNNVIVKNIDIKFGTLVWFLVKLAFAIIPAAIIIYLMVMLFFIIVTTIGFTI